MEDANDDVYIPDKEFLTQRFNRNLINEFIYKWLYYYNAIL